MPRYDPKANYAKVKKLLKEERKNANAEKEKLSALSQRFPNSGTSGKNKTSIKTRFTSM